MPARKKGIPPALAPLAPGVQILGPWSGRFNPSYELKLYREGNPRKPVGATEVNLESAVSIETGKNISNIAGSWRIVLKDSRALHAIQPMDVVIIRLKGHKSPMTTVLHGLVDEVGPEGSASLQGATENTIISGRCMAKYLQVNSFFLPVWSPGSGIPTTLTYGTGDPQAKAGTGANANTPKAIFGAIFRRFILGEEPHEVGMSGTPAARYWLNKDKRFEIVRENDGQPFKPLFLQFDENTCDAALTDLTVLGLTEAWIDEFGYVVYRPPGWTLPINYVLSTDGLLDWTVTDSDVGMATYVEVIPAAAPAVGTGAAEALLAGRAPIPKSYLAGTTGGGDPGGAFADPAFVIDTDSTGKVTPGGKQNYWYKRQRKYGLRPMQVTSPLLATHSQAQAQAEGLLEFFGNRFAKSATIRIPGESTIRLGTTLKLVGSFRGRKVDRTYFVEGVKHSYIDGQGYTTTLELTHGRDATDPKWHNMVLPTGSTSLAEVGGVVTPSEPSNKNTAFITPSSEPVPGTHATVLANGHAVAPSEAPTSVQTMIEAGNKLVGKPYVFGGAHGESLKIVRSGYDCSTSVDFLLYHGGLLGDETPASGALESYGDAGAGKWVTIYANAEHVYMYVAGIRWDTHQPGGSVGIGWYGQARSNEGFVARHPRGL